MFSCLPTYYAKERQLEYAKRVSETVEATAFSRPGNPRGKPMMGW